MRNRGLDLDTDLSRIYQQPLPAFRKRGNSKTKLLPKPPVQTNNVRYLARRRSHLPVRTRRQALVPHLGPAQGMQAKSLHNGIDLHAWQDGFFPLLNVSIQWLVLLGGRVERMG